MIRTVDDERSPNKLCRLILKLKTEPKNRNPEMQTKTLTKAKTGSRAVAASLAAPTPKPAQPVKAAPSHDEIAQRAYEIYETRGRVSGRELEDWVQAEHELVERLHRNN